MFYLDNTVDIVEIRTDISKVNLCSIPQQHYPTHMTNWLSKKKTIKGKFLEETLRSSTASLCFSQNHQIGNVLLQDVVQICFKGISGDTSTILHYYLNWFRKGNGLLCFQKHPNILCFPNVHILSPELAVPRLLPEIEEKSGVPVLHRDRGSTPHHRELVNLPLNIDLQYGIGVTHHLHL